VASTPELTSWILGYGADACVLAPSSLRNEVIDHYRRALVRRIRSPSAVT
jgi:predicted DNA-binding transcriptional regulator YafY